VYYYYYYYHFGNFFLFFLSHFTFCCVALRCVFVGQLKVLRNGVWDGIFFSLVTGCDYHRLVYVLFSSFFSLLSLVHFVKLIILWIGWYLLFYRVGKTWEKWEGRREMYIVYNSMIWSFSLFVFFCGWGMGYHSVFRGVVLALCLLRWKLGLLGKPCTRVWYCTVLVYLKLKPSLS